MKNNIKLLVIITYILNTISGETNVTQIEDSVNTSNQVINSNLLDSFNNIYKQPSIEITISPPTQPDTVITSSKILKSILNENTSLRNLNSNNYQVYIKNQKENNDANLLFFWACIFGFLYLVCMASICYACFKSRFKASQVILLNQNLVNQIDLEHSLNEEITNENDDHNNIDTYKPLYIVTTPYNDLPPSYESICGNTK